MSWFSAVYLCSDPHCAHRTERLVKRELRSEPNECERCGAVAHETIGAPAVMQRALPDGTKRPGWAAFKEASKLEVEASNLHESKRGDHAKEIAKLKNNNQT